MLQRKQNKKMVLPPGFVIMSHGSNLDLNYQIVTAFVFPPVASSFQITIKTDSLMLMVSQTRTSQIVSQEYSDFKVPTNHRIQHFHSLYIQKKLGAVCTLILQQPCSQSAKMWKPPQHEKVNKM